MMILHDLCKAYHVRIGLMFKARAYVGCFFSPSGAENISSQNTSFFHSREVRYYSSREMLCLWDFKGQMKTRKLIPVHHPWTIDLTRVVTKTCVFHFKYEP